MSSFPRCVFCVSVLAAVAAGCSTSDEAHPGSAGTGGSKVTTTGGTTQGGSGGSTGSGGFTAGSGGSTADSTGGRAASGGESGTGSGGSVVTGTGGRAASGGSVNGGGGGVNGGGGSVNGGGGGLSGGGGVSGAAGGISYEPIKGAEFDDMPIYPGNPPNFKTGAPKENVNSLGQYTNVSIPTLRRYKMDGAKATGFAYLVFPGGGYSLVDMDLHGAALAKRAAPLGVAVFALKYRVSGGTTNAPRDGLIDAKRAIRFVKENAGRWGVDVSRLGVIGTSAGSHMTMNLAANFDAGNPGSADPIEKHSSRPAFLGLMATWAMGATSSPFKFPSDVPPAFFCHAEDDNTAPIALPKAVEALIRAQGAATKLDFYATGAHSSCHPGDPTKEGHNWPDKFWPWVQTVVH